MNSKHHGNYGDDRNGENHDRQSDNRVGNCFARAVNFLFITTRGDPHKPAPDDHNKTGKNSHRNKYSQSEGNDITDFTCSSMRDTVIRRSDFIITWYLE